MFGLDNGIKKLVLKLIDETLGKKYKEIDKFTDLFQGVEPQIKQILEKIKDLENIAQAHEDNLKETKKELLLLQYRFKQMCADSMLDVRLKDIRLKKDK